MNESTLLIISAEDDSGSVCKRLLQQSGYNVISASTQEMASQFLNQSPDTIIFIGEGGHFIQIEWLCKIISSNKKTRRTPIIFLVNEMQRSEGPLYLFGSEKSILDWPVLPKELIALIKNGIEADKNNTEDASADLQLDHDIHRAILSNPPEFEVYFQPKIDLHTGCVSGAEALVRWQHPQLGLVPPALFIQHAEKSGFIEKIGELVLRTACREAKRWTALFDEPIRVAVNVSATQFQNPFLIETILNALKESQLSAEWLELELTESMMMLDVNIAINTLKELKKIGVTLAMDDFGTGYSSLGYLKKFPFDYLKIDRSFIHNIVTEPDDALIAIAVIAMAHSLRMEVIAEGVETESQMRFLQRQGCDQIQGYYYSKPLPAENFFNFLQESQKKPKENIVYDRQQATLLIVDDEESILKALQRVFRRSGYKILLANSAEQALELLALNDVQVVIADQRMPYMSGSELFHRARELYPETIRVMLTGYTELQGLTSAINGGGIYKFLTKPWDDEDVRNQIQAAFAYHDQMQRKSLRQGPRFS